NADRDLLEFAWGNRQKHTLVSFLCLIGQSVMDGHSVNHPGSATSFTPASWLARLCADANRATAQVSPDALAQAGSIFPSLADSVPVSVLVKDLHGRRVFVNQSYVDLLERQRQDILGKTDADLFPEELARKYREDDERVAQTGAPLRSIEELQLPNG